MGAYVIIYFEISPHTDTYELIENPTTIVGKRISGAKLNLFFQYIDSKTKRRVNKLSVTPFPHLAPLWHIILYTSKFGDSARIIRSLGS
jgi:hypothetical protein